ncbi:hypothetical protein [Desulfovibrio sp. SGI.133]
MLIVRAASLSPQCLLDSLFQSRTEAEQRFRQALDDAWPVSALES